MSKKKGNKTLVEMEETEHKYKATRELMIKKKAWREWKELKTTSNITNKMTMPIIIQILNFMEP